MNRPLVFGEVLFDCFPDGTEVLGGAPFNVAWHLHGFGLAPLMLSRLGQDSHGEQVLQAMSDWSMETAGIQLDDSHPTGVVSVKLDNGQPTFEIVANQAYDWIELKAPQRIISEGSFGLLYHGSLALRSERSRQTLSAILENFSLPVFVDLNLRPPWWKREEIHRILSGARWVKLNEDELKTVVEKEWSSLTTALEEAHQVVSRYQLSSLIVTRGAEGAFLVADDGTEAQAEPAPVENLVDTVGAGDAFSSICLAGLLNNWPPAVTLQRAVRFASVVCGIRGAVTREREVYDTERSRWEKEDA